MINGAHVILFSADAVATAPSSRDIPGFDSVDAGEGWLIFNLPPPEMALHPTDGEPTSQLYLTCDDVEQLLDRLATQNVEIVRPVATRDGDCLPRSGDAAARSSRSTSHGIFVWGTQPSP